MNLVSIITCIAFTTCFFMPSDQRSLAERGAMSYVVERGCPFLAHYVRENYFDYGWLVQPQAHVTAFTMSTKGRSTSLPISSTTTRINWVSEVYNRFVKEYVPMELFKGLINCGKEYALYAIDEPSSLTQKLNVDYSAVPGIG